MLGVAEVGLGNPAKRIGTARSDGLVVFRVIGRIDGHLQRLDDDFTLVGRYAALDDQAAVIVIVVRDLPSEVQVVRGVRSIKRQVAAWI